MCGIAGVIAEGARGQARQLGAALAHRGPDGDGLATWDLDAGITPGGDSIAIIHRRLAIIDLGKASAQPMTTADGGHCLSYNGELWNHIALRDRLVETGERFASRGDGEVLLRMLALHGVAALPMLDGMFAFAWLDRTERRLVLARDHLGIKPLYYACSGGRFAFASEIAALLVLPWVGRGHDPAAIATYLAHGITDHGASTCFAAVRQVPAGHLLTVAVDRPADVMLHRWWPAQGTPGGNAGSVATALATSVALHMQADRPLGIALSGGIDSSAIAVLAAQARSGGSRMRAIGYRASDPRIDEGRWMELAAASAGVQLDQITMRAQELPEDLDDVIRCQGEPFGSTSIWAQYRVMRSAAEAGLPVMLGGQGADELFAGYPEFQAAYAAGLLMAGHPYSANRLRHGAGITWRNIAGQMLRGRKCIATRLPPWIATRRLVRVEDPYASPGRDLLGMRLRESLLRTNLPMLLRYEDRNAMRWGIENRVPFLHRPLVELALGLASSSHIDNNGAGKAVLREALRGTVPGPILARRDKIGFATPEAAWLGDLAPWVGRVISESGSCPPFLDRDAFTAHWRNVASGARPYDRSCWRTINLLRWADLAGVSWS